MLPPVLQDGQTPSVYESIRLYLHESRRGDDHSNPFDQENGTSFLCLR